MSTSPAAERAATLLHLSKPADVLAAVPYVLGFRPEHSVVVLGLAGARSRSRFAGRADLPAPDDALGRYELAERFVAPFRADGCDQAVVVGYGPAERTDPTVRLVNQTLALEGVRLREALRVEDGRYWSYVCEDARCCPPDGVPFDAGSSPVSAQAVVAGLAPWPSRDDLARSLEPVGGEAGAAMSAATDRAEQRLLRLDRGSAGPSALRRGIAAEGLPLVRSALDRHRRDGPPLSPDETAWLGVALCCLRVRDDAWVRTTPGTADADAVLWTHVLRHVTEPYRAAPAALLAFCAWQSGDTVLASVALERALSADPGYSMARLLMAVVMADMPPSGWPAISPADLARDYGESPPAT